MTLTPLLARRVLLFLSFCLFCAARAVTAAAVTSSAAATTIEMHGSGTTNPSKFFWKVMDVLEERARTPVRMTYRAVGSGTGQTEFKEDVSDFGSGDIPLNQADHASFGGNVVQVPFQLGAVSFFHNVPADDYEPWRKSLSERSRRGTMRISQRKTRTYPCRAINRLRSSIDPTGRVRRTELRVI